MRSFFLFALVLLSVAQAGWAAPSSSLEQARSAARVTVDPVTRIPMPGDVCAVLSGLAASERGVKTVQLSVQGREGSLSFSWEIWLASTSPEATAKKISEASHHLGYSAAHSTKPAGSASMYMLAVPLQGQLLSISWSIQAPGAPPPIKHLFAVWPEFRRSELTESFYKQVATVPAQFVLKRFGAPRDANDRLIYEIVFDDPHWATATKALQTAGFKKQGKVDYVADKERVQVGMTEGKITLWVSKP